MVKVRNPNFRKPQRNKGSWSKNADFVGSTSSSTNTETEFNLEEIQSNSEENFQWFEGIRIIELGVLAEGLKQCQASGCLKPLQLSNTVRETRAGYGSWLWIWCECGTTNKIATGASQHQNNEDHAKQRPVFNVNLKFTGAMIHTGLAQLSLQRFFSALEVPAAAHTSVKSWERMIGENFEKTANLAV